jgi:hypothetical protein
MYMYIDNEESIYPFHMGFKNVQYIYKIVHMFPVHHNADSFPQFLFYTYIACPTS